MTGTGCADFEPRDAVERYVAGTLDDAETDDFERHLIGCRACQAAVRIGGVVRHELRQERAAPRPIQRTRAIQIAALALAAGIIAVATVRQTNRRALRSLSEVGTPPAYGGVAVRSAPTVAETVFAEGMRRFGERRYSDAESLLTAARAQGADSVPSSFFLGITSLIRGDAARAIRELDLVIARGDTPYADEAHFYAAKAWLRRGNADSARAHLARISDDAPIAGAARALGDSITGAAR